MIPVGDQSIPTDGAELARRVAGSLTRTLTLDPGSVRVEAEMTGADLVDHLSVDLTGAVIDERHLSPAARTVHPPRPDGAAPAATVKSLTLAGTPVNALGAPLSFRAEAENVPGRWQQDGRRELWLVATDAVSPLGPARGRAVVQGDVSALSKAAATAAQELARQKGLTLRDLVIIPDTLGQNRWRVDVRGRASKGFMGGNFAATVQLHVDEALVLHVEEVSAEAGGIVGAMAGGIIQSYLRPWQGRQIPLTHYTFAGGRLTSLDVELNNRFRVEATFGGPGA